MRIDYNILWFEDDNSSYEIRKDYVKDIIESYEFNFVEPRHETNGENIDIIDYNKFDLIIADMSLGTVTSMYLLDKIRSKDVYTEVLFYSSNGEKAVRDKLAEYNIDGAYCSGRDIDDFENKATEVIKTLIKKTQNLTNIRGLVMAEVSDLDVKMTEIIEKYYADDINEDKKKEFNRHIAKNAEQSLRGNLKRGECKEVCKHVWNSKSIEEILKKPNFDSSYKARTINLIMDETSYHYSARLEKFYDDYLDDIINKRNELAHCKSFIDETTRKEILKTKEESKIYSEVDFKEIRKDILKYSKIFDELFQIVGK